MRKFDLHIHTTCSQDWIWGPDAVSTPKQVVETAIRKGLDGIAVTDHETVKGGLIASKIARRIDRDFLVIPGIEIRCRDGDLLGLGLETDPKRRMSRLSAVEAAEELREMGALVVAPHPFGWGGIGDRVERAKLDAIEGFNASQLRCINLRAKVAAHKLRLPVVAGSDAHYHVNVGNAVTGIECESDTVDSVLTAIRKGKTSIIGEKRTNNRMVVYLLRIGMLLKTILGEPPICGEIREASEQV
nr:PHP domain-containing protein [Candidatus Freyarchaeota archaeon]